MSALGRKHRAADKQFRAQVLSAVDQLAQGERLVQRIARAPNGRNSAVKIRRQFPALRVRRSIVGRIRVQAARRAKVNVHIDQSRQQRLAGRFDEVGIHPGRIRGR